MEWNVNFKLKRKESDFDKTHIKSEIITWLEDLGYEIDDLNIEEVRKDFMKIEEALKYIENAISYWSEESDYEEKDKDVKKTNEAFNLIKKTLKT